MLRRNHCSIGAYAHAVRMDWWFDLETGRLWRRGAVELPLTGQTGLKAERGGVGIIAAPGCQVREGGS